MLDHNTIYNSIQQLQSALSLTVSKIDPTPTIMQIQSILSQTKPIYNSIQQWQDSLTKTSLISTSNYIQDINNALSNFPQDNITDKELTVEDQNDFVNDINDIVKDNINWQQKLTNAIKKWAQKNPVIASLLSSIFLPIILNNISLPLPLKIKDTPQSNSAIIYNINLNCNNQIKIISEKPYYFRIEYYDVENNQYKTGWISKRTYKQFENSLLEVDN